MSLFINGQVGRWQELGRPAMFGGLLERVRQLDEGGLAIGSAEEGNSYREAEDEACRH